MTKDINSYRFPRLSVANKTVRGGRPYLDIDLISRQWVGEHYYAFILIDYDHVVEGKFYDVRFDVMRCRFVCENEYDDSSFIAEERIYPYLDGYWGERAEIVLSPSRVWTKAQFEEKPNWDHDHCRICWETIDLRANTTYMRSSLQEEICITCYENYAQKKDLSFVTINGEENGDTNNA
jgi:hypothetical protein